jgi:hypothetical protein
LLPVWYSIELIHELFLVYLLYRLVLADHNLVL